MRSLLATSSIARFRPLPVVALVLAAAGCSPKASGPMLALPVGTTPIPPVAAPAVEFDDADPSALALFRPEHSPYGAWVDDPVAGTVFVPRADEVGEGFVPYASHGHFAYREVGGTLTFALDTRAALVCAR